MFRMFSIAAVLGGILMLTGCPKPDPIEDARTALAGSFQNADANSDGALSFAEAAASRAGLDRTTFDTLDANGDGVLTEAELAGGDDPAEGEGEGAEPECVTQLSAARVEADAAGGLYQVAVTSDCAWEASSPAAWISFENGAGTGQGILGIRLAANDGAARETTVLVNDIALPVTQADGCSYTATFDNDAFSAAGGEATALVNAGPGCAWNVREFVDWVTPSPVAGTGAGTIAFDIAANDGPARNAIVEIAGQRFTLTQENGCAVTLEQETVSFGAEGGTQHIAVATADGCAWTALPDQAWIAITREENSGADGWVALKVAPNGGMEREGSVAIGTAVLRVVQDSGCAIQTVPMGLDMPTEGGDDVFTIQANSSCHWTAVPTVPWIAILGAGEGAGNASIAFRVAPNDGAARRGAIDVAGTLFTIGQEDACEFAITPSTVRFMDKQGYCALDIATQDTCEWAALPESNFIVMEPNRYGAGSGTVLFKALHADPSVRDKIAVNDIPVTIQRGGAPYASRPLSIGGNGPQFFIANTLATFHMQAQIYSSNGVTVDDADECIVSLTLPEGWRYQSVECPGIPDHIVPDMGNNTVVFRWRGPVYPVYLFDVTAIPSGNYETVTVGCGLSVRYGECVYSTENTFQAYRATDNGNVYITHSAVEPGVYVPGAKFDITTTVEGTGLVNSLHLTETLPSGWYYVGTLDGKERFYDTSSPNGTIRFNVNVTTMLPFTITYRVATQVSDTGDMPIAGSAVYQDNGGYPHQAAPDVIAIPEGIEYEASHDVPSDCPLHVGFAEILALLWPIADRDDDNMLSDWEGFLIYPNMSDVQDVFTELDVNHDLKISLVEAQIAEFWFSYAWSFLDTDDDNIIHYRETSEVMTPGEFYLLDVNNDRVIDCNDIP